MLGGTPVPDSPADWVGRVVAGELASWSIKESDKPVRSRRSRKVTVPLRCDSALKINRTLRDSS